MDMFVHAISFIFRETIIILPFTISYWERRCVPFSYAMEAYVSVAGRAIVAGRQKNMMAAMKKPMTPWTGLAAILLCQLAWSMKLRDVAMKNRDSP